MIKSLVLALSLTLTAGAAQAADLLVTPQQLAQEARSGDVVVLQVGSRARYDAGHIAGARFVANDVLAVTGQGGLTLEMPTGEQLGRGLASLGINAASRVIVTYDAPGSLPAATRVLFTLQSVGLGGNASLLDGGQPAWEAAGLPITTDAPTIAAPNSPPAVMLTPRIVDAAGVQAAIASGERKIIDARDTVFYTGARAGGGGASPQPAGHIQSAQSVPYVSLLTPEGAMKPEADLRAAFAAAGVEPGDSIIAYCHVGQQATAVIYAARLIGVDAVLYDGSYQDWAARQLPVEKAE